MNETKVYAIIKHDKHLVLKVRKNKDFLKTAENYLTQLRIDKHQINQIFLPMGDIDTNYSERAYKGSLYEDRYFFFQNKAETIEMFFGKNKIIISVFSKTKSSQKMLKIFEETTKIKF